MVGTADTRGRGYKFRTKKEGGGEHQSEGRKDQRGQYAASKRVPYQGILEDRKTKRPKKNKKKKKKDPKKKQKKKKNTTHNKVGEDRGVRGSLTGIRGGA